MVPRTSDGRVLFAIPWHDHTVVGTTDTPIDAPSYEPKPLEEEIAFVLDTAGEYLSRKPTRDDILSIYVGIRPLVKAAGSDASKTSALSRDHTIHIDGSGLLTIVGGKWTTFRGFAAEVADLVLGDLGRRRRRSTELEPIGGGRGYPTTLEGQRALFAEVERAGAAPARAELLVERYGTRAAAVAAWCAARQDAPLPALPTYTRAEIGFIMEHEMVGRLADVLFRRTDIALSGRLTPEVARAAAAVGGEALGWDAARQADEVRRVSERAVAFHGMAGTFTSPAATY